MNSLFFRLAKVVMLGIAMGLLASPLFADDAPPIPKEIKIINGEQLKKMLDNKEKFLLVDSRIANEYKDGHIPKAISVVDKEMENHKAKFPSDKDHPIVFYCNGYPKCPRSLNGAKMAMTWGYKNLFIYTGGMPDWELKEYPVERN